MSFTVENSLQIKEIAPEQSMGGAHFFNSSPFLLNKPFRVVGWQLVKEKPIAQIFFYIYNGKAISGYQSTFGSFDMLENVSQQDLIWFIKKLFDNLKTEGVLKVKIKHFSMYMTNAVVIANALEKCGFKKNITETNQHIKIQKATFEEVANRSEVIRSNKCSQLGYKFKRASLQYLPEVYNLVLDTLARKNNAPSMAFLNLKKAIEACPDNYILFTLWDDDILIAATVSIKISNSVLYNFLHSDHLKYRKVSAFTFLLKNIYLFCLENDYKVLDLGISSVNGVINTGLFKFKKARGGLTSDKNIYHLTL
ncbi:MAG: hypothetical protein L3J06_04830 [Cyclobacteriaceae bacterium]|nr:hypothetical protein [Cyclobacteriaceae bacterium]